MAGETTKSYDVGACNVFWTPASGSETPLGDTFGGVKINVATETQEIEVDQKMDAVDEIITKRTVTVEVPLAEYNMDNLLLAFPGSKIITDATTETKKQLVITSISGASMVTYGGQLRLHPLAAASDTDVSKDWTFFNAAPTGNFDVTYDKQNLKVIGLSFKAYVSTATDTLDMICAFGDTSAKVAAEAGGGGD